MGGNLVVQVHCGLASGNHNQNSYASTIIHVEKEQHVITTGPYSIVRHPMYLGMILMLLFTPLALGSYWAVLPFLLSVPMNILRIKNEEEVLLRDLPGYKDYCLKTPYRLIPLNSIISADKT
ncbi:hypothetical protein B5S50_11140 [Clostridium sp. 001]|nr:hypothetical protein B5S50_11140 [Clostridium sp. 001]